MTLTPYTIGHFTVAELVERYGSPLYVYDKAILDRQWANLTENITWRNTRSHYAAKANSNPAIISVFKDLGAGIEIVSAGEMAVALKVGYDPSDMLFTCSNISRNELYTVMAQSGIMVNVDSLTQLKRYGERRPGAKVGLRINQGIGAGGHKHIITGGPDSKFGIDLDQIEEVKKIAKKYRLRIVGIHQHIGSNILKPSIFMKAIRALLDTALLFEGLEYIDFGGGFGVPYKPGVPELDMVKLGRMITQAFEEFGHTYGSNPIMRFESGRYLVAQSGFLLATVTEIKKTPHHIFVGVDTGFNHLIRPAMYQAYHHIVNGCNIHAKPDILTIAGNICESGDLFCRDREMTSLKEDDVVVIENAGAYGKVMASRYNSRGLPAEILVDGDNVFIIQNRESMFGL